METPTCCSCGLEIAIDGTRALEGTSWRTHRTSCLWRYLTMLECTHLQTLEQGWNKVSWLVFFIITCLTRGTSNRTPQGMLSWLFRFLALLRWFLSAVIWSAFLCHEEVSCPAWSLFPTSLVVLALQAGWWYKPVSQTFLL